MNASNELLLYIYQNCKMGNDTLTTLINTIKTKDNKIKKVLESEIKEFEKYIKNQAEYTRLKDNYWLEHDGDFVAIDGTIKSPWCEHLMQHFSNCFSRIGLDNPTDDDYKKLIENCYKE